MNGYESLTTPTLPICHRPGPVGSKSYSRIPGLAGKGKRGLAIPQTAQITCRRKLRGSEKEVN